MYPTDLGIKYELGLRLLRTGTQEVLRRAISLLQQASRDPKCRIKATVALGQAYMARNMPKEAVDTMEAALKMEGMDEASRKGLLFDLGCLLEKMDKLPEAEAYFSELTKMDINYRNGEADDRLTAVRKALEGRGA